MTHLTISEDSGEEFVLRGHNTVIDEDEDAVVFYSDVSKVHVVPKEDSFTIQVLTPEVFIEMDFAHLDEVHEALSFFETKKVLEVDFDDQNSVRIMPPTVRRARITHSQMETVSTGGILIEKASGIVSGEGDAKEPQTRHQPPVQARLRQFEEWHPSHMKTGLRNRRIGKRVPVRLRKKA